MSKYYVEAFYENGSIILGNCDGQNIIYAKNYKNTKCYKDLKKTKYLAKVAYHEIRCAITRKVVETVFQKGYKPAILEKIKQNVTLDNLFTKEAENQ